jgi:hypothetical protein
MMFDAPSMIVSISLEKAAGAPQSHCPLQLGVFVRIRNNFIQITDNFGIIQIIIRIIRIMDSFS